VEGREELSKGGGMIGARLENATKPANNSEKLHSFEELIPLCTLKSIRKSCVKSYQDPAIENCA
jgi:hypothetical protein